MVGFYTNEAYTRLVEAQAAFVAEQHEAEAIDTGEKLKAARIKMDLTQQALADLLGIQAPALSQMENGGQIKPQTDFAMRYLVNRQ